MSSRKRIAVVGGGVAGLSAAFLLQKKHDITLFEADPSLGGHAHSEVVQDSAGKSIELDTAFLIFNTSTYDNFLQFMRALDVSNEMNAEMSSCFSDPFNNLHFALGLSLGKVFAQKRNFFNPAFYKFFFDLAAFRKRAYADMVAGRDLSSITLGNYLAPYGEIFVHNFVLPFTSAIWSLSGKSMLDYPASSILTYFYNHQLLAGKSPRCWKTFSGSSGHYVRAFEKDFRGNLQLGTIVTKITRTSHCVKVEHGGKVGDFDEVVLATHADVSARLLGNPLAEEVRLLGEWEYQDNPTSLHTDTSLLHADPGLWCSWNMRKQADGTHQISYCLNRVQKIESPDTFILTLGEAAVAPGRLIKKFRYRHPIFNSNTVATQKFLGGLNGKDRLFYCGSYFGHGFHEDAVRSAVDVAKHFGINWDTK